MFAALTLNVPCVHSARQRGNVFPENGCFPCRVDKQNAQNEAAEKVPLNYRITCILCLANIIATY